MHSILVPTDFSEEAGFAVDLAIQIAKKNGSEKVLLFNAIETFANIDSNSKSTEEEAFEAFMVLQAKNKMADYLANKQSDITIVSEVKVGGLIEMINKKVKEGTVDMIIMGTKAGKEDYKSVNADLAVKNVKCPIITIKEAVDIESIKDIVMPLDFENEEDGKSIEAVIALQKLLGAKLHLLRVNTPGDVLPERQALARINNVASAHDIPDFEASIYAEEDVEHGIIHFAEDNAADLIMMPTHPKSGISTLISSSKSLAQGLSVSSKKLIWTYNA